MRTLLTKPRSLARLLLCTAGLLLPLAGRADTVASLLGDFSINQYCGLQLRPDQVQLHYVAVLGQLPALRELHRADTDGDGITSQAERDAYVQALAPAIAAQLALTLDGRPLPLQATAWHSSLPSEQTGFSLRLDIDFRAALPPAVAGAGNSGAVRRLTLANTNFAGKIGWHEMVVQAAPGLAVFDTNAFSSSLTGGLSQALQALPASGPLDERSLHLRFVAGAVPSGAVALGARPGEPGQAAAGVAAPPDASLSADPGNPMAGQGSSPWLQRQTRRLIDLISSPSVPPGVLLLALAAAAFLGALHAFAPGHGKTIVGAYLVGSRGTPRHAIFLGLTVTLTHTLVVFAFGLATLAASRFLMPERLFPMLSLVSGLLVFGMGAVMLVQRWRGARVALARLLPGRPALAYAPGLALDHDHDHRDDHSHDHPTAPAHLHRHSHGGFSHSHAPPGAAGDGAGVSWRGLLALGVSGGLLPCPSAMVLLLAAVALNKTGYGLLLVLAFSLGLAVTLSLVGMAFLYARNRFAGRLGHSAWVPLMPALSACLVTGLGLVLCYGALAVPGA
jgi:ABC-type nickel/cobalt efflux system permease component RcnA